MAYKLVPQVPTPKNPRIATILFELEKLSGELEDLRTACQHSKLLPVSYTESVGRDGCCTVGVFDIRCVCVDCGHQVVQRNSPPMCSCCNAPLMLVVWDGQRKGAFSTEEHQREWEEECARRGALMRENILGYDMYFMQFGSYVCLRPGCEQHDVSCFYITPGD